MLDDSQKRNSISFPIIRQAYISLKACPVTFQDFDQLSQLSGFESESFRREIYNRLQRWCEAHGKVICTPLSYQSRSDRDQNMQASSSKSSKQKQSTLSGWSAEKIASSQPQNSTNKRKKSIDSGKGASTSKTAKKYIPQHRTGTHGILVALFGLTADQICTDAEEESMNDNERYFSKTTIISYAQTFSDAKYIPAKAPPGFGHGAFSFHSAWSGMKTLINRGYVFRKGNPARFGLSKEGWNVARTCAGKEKDVFPGCFGEGQEGKTKKSGHSLEAKSTSNGEKNEDRTVLANVRKEQIAKVLHPSDSNKSIAENVSRISTKANPGKTLPITPINLISSDDLDVSKENDFVQRVLETPSPSYGRKKRK